MGLLVNKSQLTQAAAVLDSCINLALSSSEAGVGENLAVAMLQSISSVNLGGPVVPFSLFLVSGSLRNSPTKGCPYYKTVNFWGAKELGWPHWAARQSAQRVRQLHLHAGGADVEARRREPGEDASRLPPWELFLYFCFYKTQEDIKNSILYFCLYKTQEDVRK